MKIALISNDTKNIFPHYGNGGTQSCVENLAVGLHEANKDFFIICPKRKYKNDINYPFKIIEADFFPKEDEIKNNKTYEEAINEIVSSEKPDLVLTQQQELLSDQNLENCKLITTRHDSGDKNKELIYKPNLKYRFISQNQYNTWVRSEDDKKCSFWCYTGFSDQEYDLNLKPEDYYLWVGSFGWGWEAKGLNIFIELANYFKEKSFVIYGCGNPPIEELVLNSVKDNKNIYYGGMLKRGDQHKKVFKNAKCLVQLSNMNEAYGRTSVEAMSKGTPVITNFNGANPEIVDTGGLRINSGDELLNAIEKVGSLDREEVFNYSKKFHVKHEVRILTNV